MRDDSGKPRRVDDFQPRANIRKQVKEGKLNLNDEQSIKSFAEKYIVTEEHVVNAVRHIYENTVAANLHKKEREKETQHKKEKKLVIMACKNLLKNGSYTRLTQLSMSLINT